MAFFEKFLTQTDVEKRLAVPTKCLARFEGLIQGAHIVDLKVKDGKGKMMTFRCTTRKNGYKKPVFTKGWREYVRGKKLKVRDKITFRQSENEISVYKIEAKRKITILGQQVWSDL